jgi:MFS transporter, DHA1 family, inner membrane transport protein
MTALAPAAAPAIRRPVPALAALTAATFLYVTTETLPVGLLAPIGADLGVSAARVGLLVTAYGLVVVVASIPLTYLTRAVPRRVLLTALLAGYVASSLGSALAGSYGTLVATRVVTALGQAVFWSVVVPVAAGLFPAEVRGRALAVVFGGGSVAAVAGVPVGTWVGQHLGWRWSFALLAVAGAVALVALAATLPPDRARLVDPTGPGSEPDRRRFWALIAMTALATTGAFTFFTYLSPYLTDAVGLSAGLLSIVLLLRGLAGIGGVALAGPLVDARPRLAIALPVAVQAAALLLLVRPPGAVAAVVLVALTGYAFAAFTTPLSSRILQTAPIRVDLAVSGTSTAVNVGITLGALLGSALLDGSGVRATALAGGLLTLAALTLAALDRPRRTGRSRSFGRHLRASTEVGPGSRRTDSAGQSSASTAPRPPASTCARPARCSVPSSARSSSRRTSATAAATACPPARTG